MQRRHFLTTVAAAALATRLPATTTQSPFDLVAATDRTRILRNAARWLPEPPQTITAFPSDRNPGGPHDYFSEADYFWPNPATPTGLPWKERDGQSNPANFLGHRNALIRLSLAVPALVAAFRLTHQPRYAHAAAAHLRAWFITPATRMNPSLPYAQGFRGGPTGRSYGVIDTLQLVEVARAASFLKATFTPTEYAALQSWFADYLTWLQTSDPGEKEGSATNNHAIAYALQVAEFARLTADAASRAQAAEALTGFLAHQMAPDGSFPRETARTKPFGYSIFTFDCITTLAWSLSGPEMAHPNPEICRTADFLARYLRDKSTWPFPHDVQHWDSWPVRSPGLLFTGLACRKPEYIALWKTLDPDPTDPEVIRNFPIRQPLLWV